ncbi:MAG TPA: phytanoyl-CoA dioxygenase family protein, partial [Candidatus Binatia bacterium]|nr:phytanoyl-CoA dioxygenase family protein [Candidatus Binatia bacterium]
YLAPLHLCAPEEMAPLRAHIETEVLPRKSAIASCGFRKSRHLDDALVFQLASHPALLDAVQPLLGGNLVLWRTQFFVKNPGDREIPWHHDGNFLKLDPMVNVSAWIAIDAADEANSCLQVIPRSHRHTIGHVPAPEGMEFNEMADPAAFDVTESVDVPLQPGQFMLFSDRILHHSNANKSDRRRLGLAVRFTHTGVRIDLHKTNPGQYGIVVRGRDELGVNQYAEPPKIEA